MSTRAQVKTHAKSSDVPAASRIPQPPVPELEHEVERPDIAAQLEGAVRLGHSLGVVGVDGYAPPIIQRQEIPEDEEEELQLKREPAVVQRQEIPEEEDAELMMKPEEGRVGSQGGQVPPEVESAINRARGGGQPLEGALQEQMSASLGHDFSRVRVHTDSEADELNQQLQARAFTTGADIFFKRGAYDPASRGSRDLIAHELSHVVQQSTGWVRGDGSGMTVRPAGEAFEQEADSVTGVVTRFISTLVQRQMPDEEELQAQKEGNVLHLRSNESQPESGCGHLVPRINSAGGSGPSLSSDVRVPMEKEIVADFHDVQAHNGSDADAHKKRLSANGFTIGSAPVFMCGEWASDPQGPQRVVARPDWASTADTMARPRTVGNRAVRRLLTRRQNVVRGKRDDPLEDRGKPIDEQAIGTVATDAVTSDGRVMQTGAQEDPPVQRWWERSVGKPDSWHWWRRRTEDYQQIEGEYRWALGKDRPVYRRVVSEEVLNYLRKYAEDAPQGGWAVPGGPKVDDACWNWAIYGGGANDPFPQDVFTYIYFGPASVGSIANARNRRWIQRHEEELDRFRLSPESLELMSQGDVDALMKDALSTVLKAAGYNVVRESNYQIGCQYSVEKGINWTHWYLKISDLIVEKVPGGSLSLRPDPLQGGAVYTGGGVIEVSVEAIREKHVDVLNRVKAQLEAQD